MATAIIVVLILVCLSLTCLLFTTKRRNEEFGRFIHQLYHAGAIDLSGKVEKNAAGRRSFAQESLADMLGGFRGIMTETMSDVQKIALGFYAIDRGLHHFAKVFDEMEHAVESGNRAASAVGDTRRSSWPPSRSRWLSYRSCIRRPAR